MRWLSGGNESTLTFGDKMTTTPQAFRKFVGASLLLGICSVIVPLSTESLLHQDLQSFLDAQIEADVTGPDVVLMIVGLCAVAMLIVSYVGLFKIKKWGRFLFLVSNSLGLAVTPFIGPVIYTGIASMLAYASAILAGVVITLCYFTPVFQKQATEQDEARESR